ncbi:MAG: N-acetylneuraminate synthase family protein, partial [bacterium]
MIAEIGFNHNGDISTAKELVEKCARAGADCVKFQLFSAEKLLSKELLADVFPVFKKHELKLSDYLKLEKFARKKNIEIAASVFDREILAWYCQNGRAPFIKIASGDITFKRLLKKAGASNLPVVLSTAAARRKEIEQALNWLGNSANIFLLHCTPHYPTREKQLNLKRIQDLKDEFGLPVGFSDHSTSSQAPLEARGAGSWIWERHVTLDQNMEGPEHSFSLPVEEFSAVINNMKKNIVSKPERTGDGLAGTDCNNNYRTNARRSLMAATNISEGERLSQEKIIELRPNRGIGADRIAKITRKTADKKIKPGNWSRSDR